MLGRIFTVGGYTLLSRLTGFARDILLAAILGAGPVADAFFVALRLPNHFRAIFAEGAFNAAFVPAYARIHQQQGSDAVRLFGDRIFTLMTATQLALLARVDAVVCHGGHNTTVEALAHGLPLVIAPIKDDQPIVADQVVAAGAGIRIKFGRVQATELRDAVARVLADATLREGAARVRDSFAAAGGPDAAARALEALA